MRKTLFGAVLAAATTFSLAAFAQSPLDFDQPLVGKQAGTFMVRIRAIGLIPLNASSSIGTIGGHVDTTAQATPEVDLSYFATDHIAFEVIAASTRHESAARGTKLGDVDVGSTWVLPPTAVAQWHFLPHSAFSPYVGVGLTVAFFYGAQAAGPTVTHVSYSNNVGPAIEAGADYNFTGHWFANFDVKQIFLNTTAHVDALNTTIKAHTALDPLVIGAGIGYRF